MIEDEPTWAIVLHVLYEKKMAGESFDQYGFYTFSRRKAIAEEVDRDFTEVGKALSEMINADLINDVPTNNRLQGYTLTPRRFDVAHTRSLRRQEQERETRRDQR